MTWVSYINSLSQLYNGEYCAYSYNRRELNKENYAGKLARCLPATEKAPKKQSPLFFYLFYLLDLQIIFHLKKGFICMKKKILWESTVLEMSDCRDSNPILPWDLCNLSC